MSVLRVVILAVIFKSRRNVVACFSCLFNGKQQSARKGLSMIQKITGQLGQPMHV